MTLKEINIGPFSFHLYGFIIGLAILIGWLLVKKRAHLYKINKNIFDDIEVFVPILTSIFFARLYHVVDYWEIYSKEKLSIFKIYNGGIGIWGAILGGILGAYLFSRIKKLNMLALLDLVVPSMILGQAIGRIGNWVNQEGFGPPTTLPWAVYIEPENRPPNYLLTNHFHPTFFYETIFDFAIFILLIYFSKKFKRPGQVFALYLILYSTVRFFVEILRIDTWTVDGLKVSQFISVFCFLIGLYVFIKRPTLDTT